MTGPGGKPTRRAKAPTGPQGPVVFALDSGGEHVTAALVRVPEEVGRPEGQWRLLEEVTSYRGVHHSDVVLSLLEELLARQGVTREQLGLVAVGRGPGGFTGVRVAMATAVGLSMGLGVPVWQVGSLDALALNAAGAPGVAVPLIDARKGEVYGAAYRVPAQGPVEPLLPARVAPADALLAAVREVTDAPLHVFGSGALAYGCVHAAPHHWHVLPARHVAAVALREWEAAGRPAEGAPLDPAYVRKSDAELAAERKGL